MKMHNGYERLPRNYTLLVDGYEHTMSNAYHKIDKYEQVAVFDVFFREVPNKGGYAIMAGLDKVIEYIKNLKFGEQELNYYRKKGYPEEYIEYLRNFKFTGNIYAIPDGTPVFPNEPIITIEAPIIEAQIIETNLLCMINGAMEHATGARRVVEAVPKNVQTIICPVLDMGARRADGSEAAIDSSLYGMMAGCTGTSNEMAANMVNKLASGTMAHSYVTFFDSELEAFINWADIYPNNCILLVDTYDTLNSGIPNAIKAFNYMKEKGIPINNIGIRIDSGNLIYLSKKARQMLDEAGFPNATICLSNGLKAETIENLVKEGACFNSLGVGDNISKPSGRMGCVYKLVALKENNKYKPTIKLSDDTIKIVNPDFKNLYRVYDNETGMAIADVMTRKEQVLSDNQKITIVSLKDNFQRKEITNYHLEQLQQPIFINGELVYEDLELDEQKQYCDKQMSLLYQDYKRTTNPEQYYVDGTSEYVDFKNNLIAQKKLVRRP